MMYHWPNRKTNKKVKMKKKKNLMETVFVY